MSFTYRVIWFDINKNKERFVDIDDQQIALFIAKKKVSDGMQNVIIQIISDYSNTNDDPT